jgi:hypothetical protein
MADEEGRPASRLGPLYAIRANGKAGVSVEECERAIAKSYAAVQQFQLQAEPTDLGIVL